MENLNITLKKKIVSEFISSFGKEIIKENKIDTKITSNDEMKRIKIFEGLRNSIFDLNILIDLISLSTDGRFCDIEYNKLNYVNERYGFEKIPKDEYNFDYLTFFDNLKSNFNLKLFDSVRTNNYYKTLVLLKTYFTVKKNSANSFDVSVLTESDYIPDYYREKKKHIVSLEYSEENDTFFILNENNKDSKKYNVTFYIKDKNNKEIISLKKIKLNEFCEGFENIFKEIKEEKQHELLKSLLNKRYKLILKYSFKFLLDSCFIYNKLCYISGKSKITINLMTNNNLSLNIKVGKNNNTQEKFFNEKNFYETLVEKTAEKFIKTVTNKKTVKIDEIENLVQSMLVNKAVKNLIEKDLPQFFFSVKSKKFQAVEEYQIHVVEIATKFIAHTFKYNIIKRNDENGGIYIDLLSFNAKGCCNSFYNKANLLRFACADGEIDQNFGWTVVMHVTFQILNSYIMQVDKDRVPFRCSLKGRNQIGFEFFDVDKSQRLRLKADGGFRMTVDDGEKVSKNCDMEAVLGFLDRL